MKKYLLTNLKPDSADLSPRFWAIFCTDETANVGRDDATPVTEDCKAWDNKFIGKLQKVKIDVQKKSNAVAYHSTTKHKSI